MSKKNDLRTQRAGTKINTRSKPQEAVLESAIHDVESRIQEQFPGIQLQRQKEWRLRSIVALLQKTFPQEEFFCHSESSSMRPDGGILSMLDRKGVPHTILIVERKNQGTNDLRAKEK